MSFVGGRAITAFRAAQRLPIFKALLTETIAGSGSAVWRHPLRCR